MINTLKTNELFHLKNVSEVLSMPVVITVNKFNDEAVKHLSDEISFAHTTGQPVIPIVIESYGGEVYSLMAMISLIRNAKLPVATIVEGKAMSCGADLFCCGTEGYRFIDRDATLMIHDVSASTGWVKVNEVSVTADEMKRLNNRLFRMMAINCGQAEDYFLNLLHDNSHADLYLTAEDCIRHRIANHIRIPQMITEITVKTVFK